MPMIFAAGNILQHGMVLPEGHPILAATSVSLASRPWACSTFSIASAMARLLRCTERGTQSPMADLVEHGTTDADAGIGFKAGALAAVKVAGSFEQPNHTCLDQVIQQDTAWRANKCWAIRLTSGACRSTST